MVGERRMHTADLSINLHVPRTTALEDPTVTGRREGVWLWWG